MVARTTSRPYVFTVAPATSSPARTSTGTGSPVSIERSTADSPSSTTPSVAIFSPGRTTKRSPTASASTLTTTSWPSRSTRASRAPSSSSARIAAPERRRAPDSSHRPSRISVVITAPTSKYVSPTPSDERDDRPAPGGERPDRDERVHRRRAVARVQQRRTVERPAGPEDDRRPEREREPLPAVELERREHQRDERDGERRRDEQAHGARSARPRVPDAGRAR